MHHILLFHLEARQVKEATLFASHYQHLVYFAHSLEILLHTVVESEATLGPDDDADVTEYSSDTVLPTVVTFLDHFDAALDVVVGCARKTEMTRWKRLFEVVGSPQTLFEVLDYLYLSCPCLPLWLDMSRIAKAQNSWVVSVGSS